MVEPHVSLPSSISMPIMVAVIALVQEPRWTWSVARIGSRSRSCGFRRHRSQRLDLPRGRRRSARVDGARRGRERGSSRLSGRTRPPRPGSPGAFFFAVVLSPGLLGPCRAEASAHALDRSRLEDRTPRDHVRFRLEGFRLDRKREMSDWPRSRPIRCNRDAGFCPLFEVTLWRVWWQLCPGRNTSEPRCRGCSPRIRADLS